MEEIIARLKDKIGLDQGTAEKVADFIKEHADDIPRWLASSGLKSKLPGGIGNLF